MKINPNDQAFPPHVHNGQAYHGLTIRAELAARAMEGLLADKTTREINTGKVSSTKTIAADAVASADALIAELNKEEK